MVNYSVASLDATFSALADATRRAILARLARGESSVSELAEPFNVSLPAISKHLRVLENAGLLAREKDGRIHRCRLAAEPLKEAAEWMEQYRNFWEKQFDALANYLNESLEKERPLWPKIKQAQKQHSSSGGPSRPLGKKYSGPGRNRKN